MGGCASAPADASTAGTSARAVLRAHARSLNTDRVLRTAEKASLGVIRVVILGRSGTGKTSFARQLRAHFPAPGCEPAFSADEVESARERMQFAAVSTLQAVLAVADARGSVFDNAAAAAAVRRADPRKVPDELVPAMNALWRHEPALERAWDRRSTLALPSNAAFFVQRVGATVTRGFVPTDADCARVYFPSQGIRVTRTLLPFGREAPRVDFYDVGSTGVSGTLSRYKKISDLFLDARAVVYCVSLSDYDVTLPARTPGAPLANKLVANVREYERLLAAPEWQRCMIVLLLTHRDECVVALLRALITALARGRLEQHAILLAALSIPPRPRPDSPKSCAASACGTRATRRRPSASSTTLAARSSSPRRRTWRASLRPRRRAWAAHPRRRAGRPS